MVDTLWWTLMIKNVDLTETMLYVLRKKNRQISALHVYHHVSTILITYGALEYYPGGMATFSALVNSTVHVIMYTYYYCSNFKEGFIKRVMNLVKPYITIVQMVNIIISFF